MATTLQRTLRRCAHRIEDYQSHRFNRHLSTAEGPVIEGQYLYFRIVTKRAGTRVPLRD